MMVKSRLNPPPGIYKILKHLKEAWAGTLSVLYPDAKPIEGIDITYTINFIVYGIEQTNWTVAFKLVGVGQFEYVEESLKAVE